MLWIFLGSHTRPLSAIARLYRQCQTPWLSQWMLWRGRHTDLGISPAVGGHRRSYQRSHGHLGIRIDILEVGRLPQVETNTDLDRPPSEEEIKKGIKPLSTYLLDMHVGCRYRCYVLGDIFCWPHKMLGRETVGSAAYNLARRKKDNTSSRHDTTHNCDLCDNDCHSRIVIFCHKRCLCRASSYKHDDYSLIVIADY